MANYSTTFRRIPSGCRVCSATAGYFWQLLSDQIQESNATINLECSDTIFWPFLSGTKWKNISSCDRYLLIVNLLADLLVFFGAKGPETYTSNDLLAGKRLLVPLFSLATDL